MALSEGVENYERLKIRVQTKSASKSPSIEINHVMMVC